MGGGGAKAIIGAGLVCGVMDITAAFLVYGHYGAKPMRLLQGIAAGALGSRAYSGGVATAALGLFFHFVIAFGAATVFWALSRAVPFLLEQAVASGILYGVAVYFFMQLVVIPMSAVRRGHPSMKMTLIGIVIHIFCVGLPIALMVRRGK
ncbi:MAG TPA: hypothetical protein VGI16_09610 [Candidatus Acidoferrum sp.]|jgi:hypothetical protein